jgi:hypothetical protein
MKWKYVIPCAFDVKRQPALPRQRLRKRSKEQLIRAKQSSSLLWEVLKPMFTCEVQFKKWGNGMSH